MSGECELRIVFRATRLFEMREFTKDAEALVDFFPRQRLQALGAEAFDGKRSHHAAVEKSALERLAGQFFLRREIAHEPAGKRVSRPGWIFHFFDGQRGSAKRMMADTEGAF